jgi:hypothetical protein
MNDTWTFDGMSWALPSAPTYPPRRDAAAMATLGNQSVLFGGTGVGALLDDTWEFDETGWSRFTGSARPSARSEASMAWLP